MMRVQWQVYLKHFLFRLLRSRPASHRVLDRGLGRRRCLQCVEILVPEDDIQKCMLIRKRVSLEGEAPNRHDVICNSSQSS